MPANVARANGAKSKVCSAAGHVFARQNGLMALSCERDSGPRSGKRAVSGWGRPEEGDVGRSDVGKDDE